MTDQSETRFASDAYFLGPKSENAAWVRGEFQAILDHWFDWRRSLFTDDPEAISPQRRLSTEFLRERERLGQAVRILREKLCAEVPTFTPRYVGHMVSEVSLPALLGHFATLLHNPNNTSREVARVGGVIEDEAIAMLAEMVGYDPALAQGHFTGGGTVANFEAVWRARYRMDHFLSLALHGFETRGETFNAFEAAHTGWDAFESRRASSGAIEAELRECSGVLGNPFEYAERLTRATGRPWRGPVLITPGNKHFSWRKAANVFGLGEEAFWNAPLDAEGRLDLAGLDVLIERARDQGRPVLAIISVAGTTEAGEIDPVDGVCARLDALRGDGIDIWHHVDGAYGGFFCSMLGGAAEAWLEPARVRALRAIARADSVTLDPHKLGYVPYACGAFFTRNIHGYVASSFQAPYIDRAATNDKWACTLEGSRTASGAAATWLTGRSIGFGPERFGDMLRATVETRIAFQVAIAAAIPEARILPADSNILCFALARPGEKLSQANRRTGETFALFQQDPSFSVSKTVLSAESYDALIAAHVGTWQGECDSDELVLLRCVFMNPFWSNPDVERALLPAFIATLQAHMD
jgi:glutamate/tyrosine decarboxylase-like PLP-dependent enzyme